MKTQDLFSFNRSASRINESIAKTFGQRLNLESFDLQKLEDARNKLRTQIHDARSQSGFNENIENEAMTKAQWMLDAINSEIAEREEFIADASPAEVEEGFGSIEEQVANIMKKFDEDMMEIGGYGDPDVEGIASMLRQGDVEGALDEVYGSYTDKDGGEIRSNDYDNYLEDLEAEFQDLAQGGDEDEGGETDDNYAMTSAGFGSDEDYESIETEGGQDWMDSMRAAAHKMAPQDQLQKDQEARRAQQQEEKQKKLQQDIENLPELMKQYKEMKSEYESLGGSNWQYADREQNLSSGERKARGMESSLMQLANRISAAKQGATEKNENMNTNEAYINNAKDAIDILADIRQQSKLASRGESDPVRPNQLVNDLWDVMQWIESNMKEPAESIQRTQGESMSNLREGEVQQASAIVTAKTMVDRVGRWIEELSGMENDTLLQLGDSIRDEMSQEQAKTFISSVAPAIQQALENLKTTRETLATGVRMLTGEEQGAEMLGGDPGAAAGGDDMAAAEPDAMNAGGEELGGDDEFAAAEPAAGMGDAGREQRESINRSSNLLRVLAG